MKIQVVGIALGVAAALVIGNVKAHDHRRPDLTPWFESLRSKGGVACCDGKDGTSLDDPDWSVDGGRYRVRIGGQWHDVPDEALITEPNRVGHAMVWPVTYRDGSIHIRCFMPGSMT